MAGGLDRIRVESDPRHKKNKNPILHVFPFITCKPCLSLLLSPRPPLPLPLPLPLPSISIPSAPAGRTVETPARSLKAIIIMEGTIFTPSLEGMKHCKSEEGEMLTKPFLDVCKLILPVLDKFGSAMALVKTDIGGNISRLETKYNSNPTEFKLLYSMVKIEVDAKTAKASSSCTNGLLWLTRAMDFLVELFLSLVSHPDWTMSQACIESYGKTLKKWHGWLASSSFTIAMKLAPNRTKFMEVVGGTGDVNADMESFCRTFSPLLQENHKFLASVGLDDLKAS
ncbi:hypothetical protein SAY87_023614 [Trapa incisa]|uniref:Glycolipid transfer protein domain-containing protein n=1 Tax=Trapa incisa TaxID=236973 RepID=A0AAN7QUE6_9MYRT|nr:hypothetical protein SAY87_023614 [Trapa incisa]